MNPISRMTPAAALFALVASVTAHAESWTKSFVIDWWSTANYYGAKEPNQPGTDCPAGTNPENNWENY